jgi:hypothetical protein
MRTDSQTHLNSGREGAIIGHIKQFVVARAAKATFGGCVRQNYEKRFHRDRKHTVQLYAE